MSSRREFLQYLGIAAAALSLSRCAGGQKRRPNIVIIMADDMGYSDLGFFGSGIETPHINGLAANGLTLTQFYNTGRCCPSRASLLTGLYSHQAGVGDMTSDRGYPAYSGFLNRSCVTLAEVLKPAGYAAYLSGKWHVGSRKEHWPLRRGFDRFFGFPRGGGIYFHPFRPGRSAVLEDEAVEVDPETFYSTDAINDYAVQFIDEHEVSSGPFFLYVAHIAPHFPLQAWDRDVQAYRGRYKAGFQAIRASRYQSMVDRGLLPPGVALSDSDDEVLDWDSLSEAEKEEYDLRMSVYAAQITIMDRGIGRILDKLKEKGLFEDTLVLFLSDNGATHEDPTGWLDSEAPIGQPCCQEAYSRSWANVSNTPFRMYKHWVHEGGISTPCIIHYPRWIKRKRISRDTAHLIDIMSTCVHVAGAEYPAHFNGEPIQPMEGRSLVPLIKGGHLEDDRALFWEHEGNCAVRKGGWKLVRKHHGDRWELYRIAQDRSEINDLSARYPEIVRELEQLYHAWARRVGVIDRDVLIHGPGAR